MSVKESSDSTFSLPPQRLKTTTAQTSREEFTENPMGTAIAQLHSTYIVSEAMA